MDYKVDLEMFRGPLDLLLYLVKRHEVDICDIPIAKIAVQFQQYISVLHMVDVEWAGEFLVMAATLMEIKSKMLLPRTEEHADEEEDDPRLQLVKQLIEYKKFKDASKLLEEKAEERMLRLSRQPVAVVKRPSMETQPLQKVEVWDLISAFGRLMREISALQPREIVMDETPIHVNMEMILARLQDQARLTFAELFTPPYTRGRLVGLFLAVLELIKGRKIVAVQGENFGEIAIRLGAWDEQETA